VEVGVVHVDLSRMCIACQFKPPPPFHACIVQIPLPALGLNIWPTTVWATYIGLGRSKVNYFPSRGPA